MKIELIWTATWLKPEIDDLDSIISETLLGNQINADDVVNIQMITGDNGLSRFWIYYKTE